jgi:hypothetical protein
MTNKLRRALLGAIPLAALTPILALKAQSLADIEQREVAVRDAWTKTPLTVAKSIFTTGKATGFGIYTPRPTAIFPSGEPLEVYCEPVGYGFKPIGDQWEFGFNVDFLVKTKEGTILGGKTDFGHFGMHSYHQNHEFNVNLTVTLTGLQPGDYVVEFTLRDITGPKSTTFKLPFTSAA